MSKKTRKGKVGSEFGGEAEKLAEKDSLIWRLRIDRGWTYEAIGLALPDHGHPKMTRQGVLESIRRSEAKWREDHVAQIDKAKAQMVEAQWRVYRLASEGYERSCQDAKLIRENIKGGGKGKDADERREKMMEVRGQAGDPAFLGQMTKALAEIRKILGTDAPTSVDVTSKGERIAPAVGFTVIQPPAGGEAEADAEPMGAARNGHG